MDVNSSMCEFLSCAQQSFDEACVAFSQKHNMSDLAKSIDVKENVMRNMLNPEQPRLLNIPMLFTISKASSDYSIIYALLRELDIVAAHITQEASDSDPETFLKRVLENSFTAGDLSRMALDHGGDHNLPRSTRNRIIDKAQKGISNLVLLINDLENRTGSAQPFFSMSVDFITSGAAIPGLV